jgi:hypothetical protein
MLPPASAKTKQKQIPCGDDNKKGEDNDKSGSDGGGDSDGDSGLRLRSCDWANILFPDCVLRWVCEFKRGGRP